MFYFLIKVYVQSRGFLLALLPNVSFISEILIIDWSITYCDDTLESRTYTWRHTRKQLSWVGDTLYLYFTIIITMLLYNT